MFTFRAMGTDVEVTAPSADEGAIALRVASLFADAERRFSRFRDDSELARLNRARGPMVVSEALFDALARARSYVERTGGIFEPGIGAALEALGYDRSFAPGRLDRDAARSAPRACFLDVELHRATRTVGRPDGLHIDLGGMLKGSTVDAAARLLEGPGAIDAGGDAVLVGPSPTGDDWLVEIEDPRDPARTLATVAVSRGAVATSAANRRTWKVGGKVVHHLIDPRTGASADTDLLQVTVFAPDAEWADVLAKTTFVLGSLEGTRFLERQSDVGAVLVRRAAPPLFLGALDVREVTRA